MKIRENKEGDLYRLCLCANKKYCILRWELDKNSWLPYLWEYMDFEKATEEFSKIKLDQIIQVVDVVKEEEIY
jgi:hypothetical protein